MDQGRFGTNYTMEMGHEILYMECKEPLQAGSLATVARVLARYKFDLAGVQEVRQDKGGTVGVGDYLSSMEMEINWKQVCLYTTAVSTVKRVEFFSDKMS